MNKSRRTYLYPTLGEAIRALLCDAQRYRFFAGDRCKCDDPQPRTYYCAYGDCEIIRCEGCRKIIRWGWGRCYFPHQGGGKR